jgi:hypothetical protein
MFSAAVGGFIYGQPEVAGPTAGWVGMRSGPNATYVSRFIFATDTATGTLRGPLTLARYSGASTGTMNYGWFAGGLTGSSTAVSRVDRITYASDTSIATTRANLPTPQGRFSAAGDTTYGWFAGGWTTRSYVTRISYSTDTNVRSTNLVGNAAASASMGTPTNGYWVAGYASPGGPRSYINRMTYANETIILTGGSLSQAGYSSTGLTDGTTYGWNCGAEASGYGTSNVFRITYATDSSVASTRGPLFFPVAYAGGSSSASYGWIAGGEYFIRTPIQQILLSTVQRITYANDTTTASDRGPLSITQTDCTGTSGSY